jgi:vacuolar-type H+-ATPase catalytic subunit A/Vma1
MLLENIIKKHLLLLERDNYISTLKDNITIDFELLKKDHVIVRQKRHQYETEGPCAGEIISNFDIVNLVEDSLNIVSIEIVNHNIRNGKEFIVSREGDDFLNLVIIPVNTGEKKWNLIVKTLMCKQNFTVGKGQLQLYIP